MFVYIYNYVNTKFSVLTLLFVLFSFPAKKEKKTTCEIKK